MNHCPTVEIWKPVRGYETDYEVSNRGRIRRITKRILKTAPLWNGYISVTMCPENRVGRLKRKYLHRLVLETFRGKIIEGHWSDHLDGNKTHNCLHNLEAVTPAENLKRALDKGLRKQA